MTNTPNNTSAMVQLPEKKKKSIVVVCMECGKHLGPDGYILAIDPYVAKKEDGRVKRGNWCEECYNQRCYNVGFKKTKKKSKKQREMPEEEQV